MADSGSPFVLMTRLTHEVGGHLAALDIDDLSTAQRRNVAQMRQMVADCRLDTRDYELSETRVEQQENATIAQERLEALRARILAASEDNLFTAIEVARLSAELDEIVDLLR